MWLSQTSDRASSALPFQFQEINVQMAQKLSCQREYTVAPWLSVADRCAALQDGTSRMRITAVDTMRAIWGGRFCFVRVWAFCGIYQKELTLSLGSLCLFPAPSHLGDFCSLRIRVAISASSTERNGSSAAPKASNSSHWRSRSKTTLRSLSLGVCRSYGNTSLKSEAHGQNFLGELVCAVTTLIICNLWKQKKNSHISGSLMLGEFFTFSIKWNMHQVTLKFLIYTPRVMAKNQQIFWSV